jgi:hypothetical protein
MDFIAAARCYPHNIEVSDYRKIKISFRQVLNNMEIGDVEQVTNGLRGWYITIRKDSSGTIHYI